ncbi:hypothetical protein [Pararhizobium haloflavum]|uniref:hypothetical protein n=1 Tax=Pararhizobium haloflavum TaxID=2037914 RepID=UPI000C185B0B|nr:hypothetical protein [Pararhizobium haloflavum]
MHDFLKQNAGFLIAVGGGLLVSVLNSEKHSVMVAITRLAAGLFCSVFLTDPFLHYMELDPETYRNGVAGLFSMMGYAVTRFVANIDSATLLDFVRAIRGQK